MPSALARVVGFAMFTRGIVGLGIGTGDGSAARASIEGEQTAISSDAIAAGQCEMRIRDAIFMIISSNWI